MRYVEKAVENYVEKAEYSTLSVENSVESVKNCVIKRFSNFDKGGKLFYSQ